MDHINAPLSGKSVTARSMARLIGKLSAMHLVLGDQGVLSSRYLMMCLADAPSWNSFCVISTHQVLELKFWDSFFRNGEAWCPIFPKVNSYDLVLFTDASQHSGAGYIQGLPEAVCRFSWNPRVVQKSSTFRELEALRLSIKALRQFVAGKSILWNTDSANAVGILKRGSMKNPKKFHSWT